MCDHAHGAVNGGKHFLKHLAALFRTQQHSLARRSAHEEPVRPFFDEIRRQRTDPIEVDVFAFGRKWRDHGG